MVDNSQTRNGGMHVLWTGEENCYDADGVQVECGDLGITCETEIYTPWDTDRFEIINEMLVRDTQTGLIWTRKACLEDYPLTWMESLEAIKNMNSNSMFGRDDYRLPNRRELRSLIDHSRRAPALPFNHPFECVNLGWYWSSTTSALSKSYAWYLQFDGGRMFYGGKNELHWFWPVCGENRLLPATGQQLCYDSQGREVSCHGTGSDGELRMGIGWTLPRFQKTSAGVLDKLTGLTWSQKPGIGGNLISWQEGVAAVSKFARTEGLPWRMPTINELESLIDCSAHSPAIPAESFSDVNEAYWSATTSGYEPDWAYVMYVHKGAVGVGFKKGREFQVWPVLGVDYLR